MGQTVRERPRSCHDALSRTTADYAFSQNRLFQLERWRTVLDANGSSRANVTFAGFGVARTDPKALRMSSLIRF